MSRPSHDAEGNAQRMLGGGHEVPALGRGPVPSGDFSRHDYHHPAAGWGAARSVAAVLERAGEPVDGVRALFRMNHQNGGFDCPGCAAGYMPELNVLCGIADYSTQSEQPLTKHLVVEITSSRETGTD